MITQSQPQAEYPRSWYAATAQIPERRPELSGTISCEVCVIGGGLAGLTLNPAFLNRLPDDEFWAAKQIMSFGNDQIRAVVGSGEYSDPKARDWLAQCLIQRRDKIGRAFYKKVLPIDKFEVPENRLVFEDLSEKADFGAAGPYTIQGFQFDQATGATTPLPGATDSLPPAQSGPYLVAKIESGSRPNQRVDVTLRLGIGSAPTVVGVDRLW